MVINRYHELNRETLFPKEKLDKSGWNGGSSTIVSTRAESAYSTANLNKGMATPGVSEPRTGDYSTYGAASKSKVGARSKASTLVAPSRWRLPRKGRVSHETTHSAIVNEFKRLDITGEGRLNYLTLKTALELREVEESDIDIKQWLRDHDRGNKGHVDFADYESIYKTSFAATTGGLNLHSRGVGQRPPSASTSSMRREASSSARPMSNTMSAAATEGNSRSQVDRAAVETGADERLGLLQRAFDKYDVDGDGKINVDDLRIAFEKLGRAYEEEELVAWVAKRDVSGDGTAVTFGDFCSHYG